MGEFIFMMVECLRTDRDYAIFRNELRIVQHFVNLEQKIADAPCTPPIMHHICPPPPHQILHKRCFLFLLVRL